MFFAPTQILQAVKHFLAAREGARKFHAEAIGVGVDPSRCFGDFVACVHAVGGRRKSADANRRLREVYKSSLAETAGGTVGGYLVPVEYSQELLFTAEEPAIIWPRAHVEPMTSNIKNLPLPDATTAQAAGTPPYMGGVYLQYKSEAASAGAATLAETENTFRELTLTAWELGGYALASRTWEDDTPGVEAWLKRLFGNAALWFSEWYFLHGTGVGEPTGVIASAASASVTRSAAGHATLTDVAGMTAKLLPASWNRAVWIAHPALMGDIQTLQGTGGAGWQSNQPAEGNAGPAGALAGRPLYVSDKASAPGVAGDLTLVDWFLYVIGDRGQMTLDYSDQVRFTTYQGAWRCVQRGDGQPQFSTLVTMADGTKTASPYVVLV